MPPDPNIRGVLPGTGTPPEKFLPTPLASLRIATATNPSRYLFAYREYSYIHC